MLSISCARPLLCLIALVPGVAAGPLGDAEPAERMVIGTGVGCRAAPDRSAPVAHRYLLGDAIMATGETEEKGERWYFDRSRVSGQSPACWVYGPLTTEFGRSAPEPALVAVADHLLQRNDAVAFEDCVAVDNLLTYNYPSVLASSGLLQFRRLSVIERAIALPAASGRRAARNPLVRSWLLSHEPLLRYFEPADRWYVQPETYWDLYEKHKQAPWAEELAWAAARLWIPGDECYAACLLRAVSRTFLQYWTRFPDGTHTVDAIEKALSMTKHAPQLACYGLPVPRPLLDQMRSSLMNVTAPGRRQLLDSLDELEQEQEKCPGRL